MKGRGAFYGLLGRVANWVGIASNVLGWVIVISLIISKEFLIGAGADAQYWRIFLIAVGSFYFAFGLGFCQAVWSYAVSRIEIGGRYNVLDWSATIVLNLVGLGLIGYWYIVFGVRVVEAIISYFVASIILNLAVIWYDDLLAA